MKQLLEKQHLSEIQIVLGESMKTNISKISDLFVHFLICFFIAYLFKSALGINTSKEYHLEDIPMLIINKILE